MSSCWQQGCYRNFTYKTWVGVCHQREKRGRERERQRGGCVEYSPERHQRWSHLQHSVNAMFYIVSSLPHPHCSIPLKSSHPAAGLDGIAEEGFLYFPAHYVINIKVDAIIFVMRLWTEFDNQLYLSPISRTFISVNVSLYISDNQFRK